MPNTLLLADDSVTIQRVIELTFADEDVQVIAVSDGDQAIERLQASPPDIVLADIGMPGKNGYEVAQFVRQTPRLAHIPVVLLTGAFEPVDQARANEAGCDGVLAKPFEPQLVISRVKELLGRRQASSAPAAAAPAANPWPPAAPAVAASNTAAAPQQLDDYFDRLDAAFSSFNAPASAPAAPAPPPPAAASAEEIDWFTTTSGPAPEGWDLPPAPGGAAQPEAPVSFASPQPVVAFEQPGFEAGTAPSEPPAFETAPEFEAPVEFESAPAFDPPPPSFASVPAAFRAPAQQPPPAVRPHEVVSRAAAAAPIEEPRSAASMRTPASLPVVASLPPLSDAFAALLAAEGNEGGTAVLAWPATAPEPAMPVATDDLIDDITRRVLERLSDQVIRDTVADTVSRIAEQLVREEIERIKSSIKQ